jgi:Family of unknown function (DUF6328)
MGHGHGAGSLLKPQDAQPSEAAPATHPGYERNEPRAHQLDRNWAELVQELRVIGTGVQILFAFLLTIAFQTRFAQTTRFQRDVYLVVLMTAAFATATFIAPVAIHRVVFRFGVKDELVDVTNTLALAGLGLLAIAMVGAVLLVSDWVAGTEAAAICTSLSFLVFVPGWFVGSLWLRRRARAGSEPLNTGRA